MSQKNPDVERALIAFGGEAFPYHSFGPFHVRPRVPVMDAPPAPRTMTQAQAQPVSFQPAATAVAAPQPIVQPPPLAVVQTAPAATMPPVMPARPMAEMPRPSAMMAAPLATAPMMAPPPVAVPFVSTPPAPPPVAAPSAPPPLAPPPVAASPVAPPPVVPSPVATPSFTAAAVTTPVPSQPVVGQMQSAVVPTQGLTPEAERKSLDAMFRVLTARNDAAPVTAAPQPVASAQQSDPTSLFRRI